MPGATDNNNLLDGLNNLIVSMNELTTVTSQQSLDPTINVAAPDVTVNPVNNFNPTFSPDNVVNFDTESIVTELANLVAKEGVTDTVLTALLSAIQADTANLSNLGELVKIALNSDHLTHLQQLQVLDYIRECVCAIADEYTKTIPGDIIGPVVTTLVDAEKCKASKSIAGFWNWQLSTMVKMFEDVDSVTGTAAFIGSALAGMGPPGWATAFFLAGLGVVTKVLTVTGVDAEIGETTYELRPKSDYDNLLNNWQSIANDVIQTLYDNTNSDTASTALKALADAQSFPQWQIDLLKDVYFSDLDRIEQGYAGELNDKGEYGVEFHTFSTYECVDTTPSGDFSCMPRTGLWSYGTPSVISGGAWDIGTYPVNTWATVTSAWYGDAGNGNHQRIGVITFDDDYTIELEILSIPAGKELYVRVNDCLEVSILEDTYNQIGTVYTGSMASLYIRTDPTEASDPGTFQIRMRRLD